MKNKIFGHFDKAYCINLKERIDRKESVLKQFQSVGLNDVEFIDAFSPNNEGIFKTKGAHGCALSHIYIYKKIKESNYENIIIFEDDLIFSENFLDLINPIVEDLKNLNWDIFYFFKPKKGSHDIHDSRGNIIETYESGLVKTSGTILSHAYAINIKCIDTLIEQTNPLYLEKHNDLHIRAIDKALANLNLNFFACHSDLIYQDENLFSSIKQRKKIKWNHS